MSEVASATLVCRVTSASPIAMSVAATGQVRSRTSATPRQPSASARLDYIRNVPNKKETSYESKLQENVMGEFCDQCKSGTFSLSADNDKGCVDCYCFGVTDHCVSSQLPLLAVCFPYIDSRYLLKEDLKRFGSLQMSIDMSEVTTTDENGTVSVDSNNRVNYAQGYL